MTSFGNQLRIFRQRGHDSKSPHGKLTQESFGELVGAEFGIHSYTGAAVSDWERGKTKIHAEDRRLLMAMLKVLHDYEGIRTVDDANRLLKAGNFSNLDPEESERIFQSTVVEPWIEQPGSEQRAPKPLNQSVLGTLLSIPEGELQTLFAKAEAGPSPSWPRVLAALMRFVSDRRSLSIRHVFWIAVWLAGWWLIPSSLHWPFAERESAYVAIVQYVGGTLIIPLLIGLLVDTKNNKYWRDEGLAHSFLLRLYTYQGAGIGFNLGYFFVFPLALIRYYLGLGPSVWVELTAVTLGLILGNMAARVVPHNLWLAYGRLHLADGVLFFVVAFVGPLWGVFFLEYYSILLRPVLGSVIIVAALVLFLSIAARQSRKKVDSEQAQP
jgi:hypothetical protein